MLAETHLFFFRPDSSLDELIEEFKELLEVNRLGERDIGGILTHLSQRLIGELIGYQWSGVRLSSSSVGHNAQTSSFQKQLG